jgi:hypothetical protein
MGMTPKQRRQWIYQDLEDQGRNGQCDVLDSDFVNAYCNATGAKGYAQFYGAPKCPMLGRDLSRMHREGSLARHRVGLRCMESGFPSWVYSYSISRRYRELWAPIYLAEKEQAA